ncbi:MAG: DNA gyrase subunit A [Planctomycetota bacterium]|jgi:DNA gyrase subunit A|nr:DNA gyrase subunit A [Planctomycetota bacterium]MDP7249355.1 DNA gyrase subunit A [Planctomycetota bacterium]
MSDHEENIKDMLIEEGVKDSYLQYAMSVITDRALPDVRDGLKPVQRRIIYTMQDLNLTPTGGYIKTARIVGHCMGHYHPHGDSAIYDTLVRMARDWNLRYTLVQGQGNFGSMDGDRPAAMRYTEARSTPVTVDMLADIRQDTVEFKDNYDGKNSEPSVLPSRFPNLLCNGSIGIAVGMACSIPPHNLCEVVDALCKVIDEPEISPAELLSIIQGPDFPTGGRLLASESLTRGYLEGRGTAVIQAQYHIEDKKNKEWLVFTELPFQVRRDTIKESIARLVNEGTIKGISDVRDESGRDGQRLVVELKRGENADVVLNNLYQFTPLQSTFSIIMIALVNGRPMTLNIKQFLEHFRDHRVDVIRRRTLFQLRRAEERAHELEGLRIALDNLDEVIATIRNSESPDAAKVSLKARFELSEKQALAILGMRLQQLTNLEVEKLEQEYRELIERIAELKSILENRQLVLEMIKEDLISLREKYGDDRRTEISGEYAQFLPEDLIPEEDVAVVISNQGYIKRMLLNNYRQQRRGGVGVTGGDMKDDDFVSNLFVASTHDYILFFSDKGKVYWLKVYDIPQMSRTARGRALPNLIELEPDETFTSMLRVDEFDGRNVFFATSNGYVKRTPLESFSRPMKRGIRALTLDENDTLIGVELTSGENEVMLAKANGRSIRFHEHDIRSMGRTARGVRGVRLREKDDKVIGLLVVDENNTVLTLSENGYGKKTAFSEYPVKARGGLGVINMKTTDRNGKVVGMLSVSEDEDLMMVTHTGMIVRSPINGISTIGRNTQGVRLIRLREEDKLVSVARAPHEELEETEEEET